MDYGPSEKGTPSTKFFPVDSSRGNSLKLSHIACYFLPPNYIEAVDSTRCKPIKYVKYKYCCKSVHVYMLTHVDWVHKLRYLSVSEIHGWITVCKKWNGSVSLMLQT